MGIQAIRYAFEFMTDLVLDVDFEYTSLDNAFFVYRQLRYILIFFESVV